jgi:hypothetical protein
MESRDSNVHVIDLPWSTAFSQATDTRSAMNTYPAIANDRVAFSFIGSAAS